MIRSAAILLALVTGAALASDQAPAPARIRIAGIFMETHPDPAKALSDGPNAWPLPKMQALLEVLIDMDRLVKKAGFIEATL